MKDLEKAYPIVASLKSVYDTLVLEERNRHNRMLDIIAKLKLNLEKLHIEL